MNIKVTYDANTFATAPAAFYSAVDYVVNLLDSTFTNPATVNIEVGYGQFPLDGSTVTALGESQQNNVVAVDYGKVRNILVGGGAAGSSTLPTFAPLSGELLVGSAQEKALGIIGDSDAIDGWVGVASNQTLEQSGYNWSFSTTATPGEKQIYLVGVLEHEFTEAMGRVSYLDAPGQFGILDLYRYSAAGVRQTAIGGPAYFSTDSGTTNLDNFNNSFSGGDLGDWAANSKGAANFTFAGNDAFLAVGSLGQLDTLSNTDQTVMGALGWNNAPPAPRFQFVRPDQKVNVNEVVAGSPPPASATGEYNLELLTDPSGASPSLASGYQALAVEPAGGNVVVAPTGDVMIVDNGSYGVIGLGAGVQTVLGGVGDTIAGGAGNSIVMGQAGSQHIVAGSGQTTVVAAAGDTVTVGSGALFAMIDHSAGAGGVTIGDGAAAGRATITGFSQISGDRLAVANENAATIDSVVAAAQTSGGNTVITLPDGSTMTLVGITKIDGTFFV
ncbi:MAG: NF038122 family metalloprotease [Thiohalocapsa sp.]